MFVLQVYTDEKGWRFATAVWEDEVGWCYMDSPAHPAQFARIEDAEREASFIAAECDVRTAVFDGRIGIQVFQCAPPLHSA